LCKPISGLDTDEYAWYTWHTNNSGNLLAFMKNFSYYFPGQAEIKGKPLQNISLKMQALDIPQKSRSFDNILNLKYDNVLVNGVIVPNS